ncbi:MAG TPA: replication initiator protein A, partial [Planctomycetaceae bacterium]|nr:replication initiator protein A [Planctomycetaceae bacterium]
MALWRHMDFQNNRSHRQEVGTRTGARAMPITADSGCAELSRNSDQRERTISNRAEARIGSRAMPLLGRDELNLIDFPIGTLSYKQPLNADGSRPDELVFSVETFDQQLGKIIPKKLTTRTSSKYGFPTPKEEQLLVGLLLLARMKNNFTQPRVEFRSGELFALMNWPHNSSSKRQLQTGLDRLSGVKLQYENSWSTDAGQKFEKVFHTGILDSYQLTTQTSGTPRSSAEANWIQWSSEVFADIRSGNVKELNTDEFFSLKYPLARRMYRFLDKQLSAQPQFEMDLLAFAGHLGIAETEHIGKIKERLEEPIAELEALPSCHWALQNQPLMGASKPAE